MTEKGLGAVAVTREDGTLAGLVTDGVYGAVWKRGLISYSGL